MKLFSRVVGSGPPVVILHGLFGMSDNWLTIGRSLAGSGYQVHIPDLRNHGRSSHSDTHRYPDMCDDLIAYLEQNQLSQIRLIGHSMGGKLGMVFSLLYPEIVQQLVVVDIAPSDYRSPGNSYHNDIITALLAIDLSHHRERGTLRRELETTLQDSSLAQFLAKNIARAQSNGTFFWKFNLPTLQQYLQHLYMGFEELDIYAPCPVRTLFVLGADSTYYRAEHEVDRIHFFPDSSVVRIEQAGHWLHSEQPALFLAAVQEFFSAQMTGG